MATNLARHKGARYLLFVVLGLLFVVFYRSRSPAAPEVPGISPQGHDLTNEEINTLISRSSAILKKEAPQFQLKSPYLRNELTDQNYEFNGDILIRNDHYVRLTQEKKHQVSSFFSNAKLERKSFVMETKFFLGGKTDVSGLHGDGFAIFFSTEKLPQGELFGVREYYNGFAVYIDTYRNGRSGIFPYAMAARNDGTQPYDKDRDGKDNEIAGCIARNLWNPKTYTKARLVYIEDGYLSLDFDYENNDVWKNCFTLKDIFLPEEFHIGFSGHTGDLAEIVDILENRVYVLSDYTGRPIQRLDALQELLEDPNSPDKFEDVSEEYIAADKTRRKRVVQQRKDGRQTRRTIKRLQNAERRIKREAEQRRRERRERWKQSAKGARWWVFAAVLCVVGYLMTVVWRVKRRARRGGIIA